MFYTSQVVFFRLISAINQIWMIGIYMVFMDERQLLGLYQAAWMFYPDNSGVATSRMVQVLTASCWPWSIGRISALSEGEQVFWFWWLDKKQHIFAVKQLKAVDLFTKHCFSKDKTHFQLFQWHSRSNFHSRGAFVHPCFAAFGSEHCQSILKQRGLY